MLVILRPIHSKTWTNIKKFRNCHDYLSRYYTRSGNLYTGLTRDDEVRLGGALGLDLSRNSDFWNGFYVRIGGTDVFLDTNDPMDELRYIFLKNHKRVKTSMFERKATADYLLINQEEEAKRENLFNKSKTDAIVEFKKMSITDMRKCLRLFGFSSENVGSELVENRLFNIIQENPTMFLSKWVENKDREVTVLIEEAIAKNVIRRNKNVYKYGSDIIANSLEEAIDFIKNPKNQDIKLAIMNEIDAKDYIEPLPDISDFGKEDKPKKTVKTLKTKDGEEGVDISSFNDFYKE
jgi:hypothetical protein